MNLMRIGMGALAVSYIASKETKIFDGAETKNPKIIEVAASSTPIDYKAEPCAPSAPKLAKGSNGEPGSSLLIEVD